MSDVIEVYVDENAAQSAIDAAALAQQIISTIAVRNTIIVDSGFAKEENVFTGLANSEWNINGVGFTNTSSVIQTIPLAETGKSRWERMVLNTSNTFQRVPGEEVIDSPAMPIVPDNTLDYTFYLVTDSEVGEPSSPMVGTNVVKKSFANMFEFNGTGANAIIPLNPNGYSEIRLINAALTSVSGVDLSLMTGPNFESPYQGKDIFFWNRTGVDITLKHEDFASADYPLFLRESTNLVLPNNHMIGFKWDSGGLYEIDKTWINISELIGYNEHFKGKYTSLVNLQSAHPTANDGDYAIVDSGSGSDALEYIWDADEEWVKGNSTGAGSGAVTMTVNEILSTDLDTQDVAGFIGYINALSSSFAVAENEIKYFTVTDTLQKFIILLNGRSFGGSEADIVSSDVLEIERKFTGVEISEDGTYIIKDVLGNNVFIISDIGEIIFNKLESSTLYKLKSDLKLQNKIRGLNVSILGDSISTTTGGGSGILETDTYGGLLRDLEDCNIYRNAVAGTNLSTDFTADARVNDLDAIFTPDVILVFGGVNDFLEDATLGSFGDTTTATFYGGVDVLCIKLQTAYPNARIFFMTPLHHKYTSAGGLVPEYNGTNYMTEFVEAIEKVCKRYGISIINTNQDSGITCYNIDTLAPDLIHVEEVGHQMIYNTIISETNLKL